MGYYREPGDSRIATRPAATSASPSKSSGSPKKLWMARWMKERAKGPSNLSARPSLSSPFLSKRPTQDDWSCKTDITHTFGAFPGYQDILAHPSGCGMKYFPAQTGVWVAGVASSGRTNIWCPCHSRTAPCALDMLGSQSKPKMDSGQSLGLSIGLTVCLHRAKGAAHCVWAVTISNSWDCSGVQGRSTCHEQFLCSRDQHSAVTGISLSHTTTVSSASANLSRQGYADDISTPQDLFCQRTTTPCLTFMDLLHSAWRRSELEFPTWSQK